MMCKSSNDFTNLKPAVGYCRFSSDKQKELSIEAQQRAITSFCARNGYYIKEWFIDRGYSGKNMDRPDFQRMKNIIESGESDFEAVIFHKLDRLSRSHLDSFYCQESFSKNNVLLLSVEENNLEDEFMFGINALLNQRYVNNLAKEVMKGLRERAHKGLFNGGKPPLGYAIVDGHYEIVESEAIIIKTIFELAADGYGYNHILKVLNSKGYKTRGNNSFGKNSLYELLHNERFKGVYTYSKALPRKRSGKRNTHSSKEDDQIIRIPDAIPKIVSEDLWERANASRKLASKLSTNAKSTYMLSGLLICNECSAKMHGNRRHGSTKIYNTYRCNREANQVVTCTCKEIHADILEKFVIDSLMQHFFSDDVIEIIVSQVDKKIKEITQRDSDEVNYARNALQGLKVTRNNLVEAIAQTGFNQTLSDKLETTENQIKEYQKIINTAEAKKSEITITRKDVEKKIKTLREDLLNTKNAEKTKILLHQYIERVLVDNHSIKATFKVAFSVCIDNNEVEICYNHTVTEARRNLQKSA